MNEINDHGKYLEVLEWLFWYYNGFDMAIHLYASLYWSGSAQRKSDSSSNYAVKIVSQEF